MIVGNNEEDSFAIGNDRTMRGIEGIDGWFMQAFSGVVIPKRNMIPSNKPSSDLLMIVRNCVGMLFIDGFFNVSVMLAMLN